MNDCGCKVIVGKKRVPLTLAWEDQLPEIEYCPLHANAEKMRDALKKIRAIMYISEPIDVIVNAALKELDT